MTKYCKYFHNEIRSLQNNFLFIYASLPNIHLDWNRYKLLSN